jgi:hypothetical protein
MVPGETMVLVLANVKEGLQALSENVLNETLGDGEMIRLDVTVCTQL